VRATADLVDGDPTRKEIRATVTSGDKLALARLAKRLDGNELPPAAAVMLGSALEDKLLYHEAVRILRQARDRAQSDTWLLGDLSICLRRASPDDPVAIEESVGCARTLVAVHPENARSHYVLGQALHFGKKDPSSAEPHYRKTLELNPRFTHCMANLASIRRNQGDPAGAEQWYRKATEIDPQFGMAHSSLAEVLQMRGELAGAEVEYRTAIALDPTDSWARQKLVLVQRVAPLVPRLDAVLAGRSVPASPAEAVNFALLCAQPFRRNYAAATRLLEQAFASDPKLADNLANDLSDSHRYYAAFCAVLAASGQGSDATADPVQRAALRGKALAWLRADLTLRSKQAASYNAAERKTAAEVMSWWLEDKDLATVRTGEAKWGDLTAAERPGWESLWSDVRATLAAAQKPVPPPQATTKP
jgi:tetratricopeptide (TPR) repeat protein